MRLAGKNYFRFEVYTGVKQGSVLSPLRFIILMDLALKTIQHYRESNDETKSKEMAYAYDILLITSYRNVD